MHGLVLTALQSFMLSTYGRSRWENVIQDSAAGVLEFEAMMTYPVSTAYAVLDTSADQLGRSRDELLEDLGTFLVSDTKMESFRRLMRFSGVDYVDFLYALEELPERTRLAVPDLILPGLELRQTAPGLFQLVCEDSLPGFGSVLLGVLRAMADDYGALVILDRLEQRNGQDVISIALVQDAYAEGKSFELKVAE